MSFTPPRMLQLSRQEHVLFCRQFRTRKHGVYNLHCIWCGESRSDTHSGRFLDHASMTRESLRLPLRDSFMGKIAVILASSLVFAAQALAAATGLPFRSDFENNNFDEWDGGPDETMTITSQQASSGRYSVQAVMTRGQPTDNYKDYVFGDHPRVRGTPVSSSGLWLAYDSKFDEGFQFGRNSAVHKSAIINFEDENGRRRYQIIVNVFNSTGEYFLEHLKWNADRSFGGALNGLEQHIGTPAKVRLGQWDRIKLFIKPNTPGRADGIVRLWINGELKVDRNNVPLREGTNYNPNKLIMSNYVTDTTTSGIQRWDNFYLGETDPDASTVRPRPPVLESVE